MKRSVLEHIIRAASTVTRENEFIIIGTGAILGKVPDAPRDLRMSPELDIYPKDKPELANDIDGSLGEITQFHTQFGYYAHGVGPETAVLPKDWKTRLVKVQNENTNNAIGWCLDPHDLAFSKLAAGRPKDRDFVAEMLRHKIIKRTFLESLISKSPEPLQEKLSSAFRRIKTAAAKRTIRKADSNGRGNSPSPKQ